jgi:hypothetical protein
MTLFKSRIERRNELIMSICADIIFLCVCLFISYNLGLMWWNQFYIDIRYSIIATLGLIILFLMEFWTLINLLINIDSLTQYIEIDRWLNS